MRKMDLEARNVVSSVKATLLVKIREYRNDLNNLKTELKRLGSSNAYQATRAELMGSGNSNTVQVSLKVTYYFVTCFAQQHTGCKS